MPSKYQRKISLREALRLRHEREIAERLAREIKRGLPEPKLSLRVIMAMMITGFFLSMMAIAMGWAIVLMVEYVIWG